MLVRVKISPAMLVRVNFAVVEFKPLPIEHNFGSPRAFTKPVGARTHQRFVFPDSLGNPPKPASFPVRTSIKAKKSRISEQVLLPIQNPTIEKEVFSITEFVGQNLNIKIVKFVSQFIAVGCFPTGGKDD